MGSENKVAEHLLQLHSPEMFALWSASAHSLALCAQMLRSAKDSTWSRVGGERTEDTRAALDGVVQGIAHLGLDLSEQKVLTV